MAKVWRCDRWDAVSITALLTILLVGQAIHAACWVDSNPMRIQSNPVAPNIVLYEWHIKHSLGTDIVTTTTNILSTSDYGLDDSPIQISVIQQDEFGNRSPESPRSDFIFPYPPFGTDLNGDGLVNQNDDYYGRPFNTGMAATFGCRSCAVAGLCPPESAASSSFTPFLLPD